MIYPNIQQYRNVLLLPKGNRPFRLPELDSLNMGDVLPSKNRQFLHWGNGGYAVVFRCLNASNTNIALRCPLGAPAGDICERWTEVEAYRQLHINDLPFLVRSEYVADAIKVGGEWFPVFIMEWVEGETLGSYVAGLVAGKQRDELGRLADRWQSLVNALEKLQIAHGDLQHGNVMVTKSGDLRLVDYDTVFVPALANKVAVIIGTPGYVHPSYIKMGQRPYNAAMDSFGALVILLSLRVLALDPSLYHRFSKENLFFSAEDLEEPRSSDAFKRLKKFKDPEVADLTRQVFAACQSNTEPALNFPSLEPLGPAIPRVVRHTPPPSEYEPGSALRRSASTSPNEDYTPGSAIRKS